MSRRRPLVTAEMVGCYVQVVWVDSQHQVGQVDAEDLPEPSELTTVGHLSAVRAESVVVSRDRLPNPSSFEWRGNLAIPLFAVRSVLVMHVEPVVAVA